MKAINFIDDKFLLKNSYAVELFHTYAKHQPIIDYHNHLSAKQIAENKAIENITDIWLAEDHYKWRGMRANGIDEKFITGTASSFEKFEKWAETIPYTIGNPLFHWTHLELKRYFGIDEILQPSTAKEIYTKVNEILKTTTPDLLLAQMNVEVVCTTDDPSDSLEYHMQIAAGNFKTKVLPTFRSDALFTIDSPQFSTYLEKLQKCVGFEINNLQAYLKAIAIRIDFFNEAGCKLSDYGLEGELHATPLSEEETTNIFNKYRSDTKLTSEEISLFKSFILYYLGRKYHEKGWTQQYHLGAIRNNNKRLQQLFGNDAGCDSIGDIQYAKAMSTFLNQLDFEGKLTKTITYNLNSAHNDVFATMMGNFNTSEVPGKMQYGAAWWFLDQKDGMENQLKTIANLGLLSRFIGMLTDSRSFLSFPRHEYFRRILCNYLGTQIALGEIPNDLQWVGKIVSDICYHNSKSYFNF